MIIYIQENTQPLQVLYLYLHLRKSRILQNAFPQMVITQKLYNILRLKYSE
jgi:hypothetical protein